MYMTLCVGTDSSLKTDLPLQDTGSWRVFDVPSLVQITHSAPKQSASFAYFSGIYQDKMS